jgi:hypothetical protein
VATLPQSTALLYIEQHSRTKPHKPALTLSFSGALLLRFVIAPELGQDLLRLGPAPIPIRFPIPCGVGAACYVLQRGRLPVFSFALRGVYHEHICNAATCFPFSCGLLFPALRFCAYALAGQGFYVNPLRGTPAPHKNYSERS